MSKEDFLISGMGVEINKIREQIERLKQKQEGADKLAKGECKLLVSNFSNPKAHINPLTNRLKRPTIALYQGSKKTPYNIKLHETYELSCDCPSWIYNQRGNRTCKHTDIVKNMLKIIKVIA